MKLATRKNGSRDGELLVVSQDLSTAVSAAPIANTLQQVLDDWHNLTPSLKTLYNDLNNHGVSDSFQLITADLMSPLPRAYQWIDGSAYVNHVELVRQARGAEMPASFWTDPLMYQGGSDSFVGPNDNILVADEQWGVDFEAEICVIVDDVPMGVSIDQAASYIKLILLVNDVSLRNLIPSELAKGFGFFNSKPSSAFSPTAVTCDELGEFWDGKKLHLPLVTHFNGTLYGKPNAGIDMTFDFPTLIAHAAKTRPLSAGSILGSGTVSNRDRSVGSSCIAEQRMLEIIEHGEAKTAFMQYGDTIKIDMMDKSGQSIFGAIEQTVEPYCCK